MRKMAWCVAGILAISLCSLWLAGNAADKEKGLSAYWKLDEGKGEQVKDSSGNNNVGELSAEWVKGKFGNAIYMKGDGASNIIVADNETLQFGRDSFSFSFWAAPITFDIDSDDKRRRILEKSKYPETWWCVNFTDKGNVMMEMADEGAKWGGSTSNGALEAKKWTQVVIVNDRKAFKTKYYFNGKMDSALPIDPGFTGNLNSEAIDLVVGTVWQQYMGLLSELKIYKRALTDDEIKADYEKGKVTKTDAKFEGEDED